MKKHKEGKKFKGVIDLKSISKSLPKNTDGVPFIKEIKYILVLNIVVILISLGLFNWLPPELPIFYGHPTGSDQIKPWWFIGIPSFFSILIIGLNILLSSFAKQDFIKKALIITAIAVSFLSLVTTLKIIFLVGNIF